MLQPPHGEIRAQLDRILASEPFAASDRLRRFLRYVVERTLAGEGDRLKEYVVGTEVFDRDDRYDPRVDSLVRVEAGRLRARLDEYYSRQGLADPVIIRVPRGSYAPVFEHRQVVPAVPVSPESTGVKPDAPRVRRILHVALIGGAMLLIAIAAGRAVLRVPDERSAPDITIAVLPFASYSTDEAVALLAARMTDGVTSELARLGTVGVVSHTSALQFAGVRRPLSEVARALNAGVVLEASLLLEGDCVRVDARLVDAGLDRKFWVEEFEGPATELRALQRHIATAAARAAARPPRASPSRAP
ncbi:MAG: hypothetical protein ACRD26_21865 [Vicinamibacterales bacterium]